MDGDKQHYVWIKEFNRFMYNQTKHKNRKHKKFLSNIFQIVLQLMVNKQL